MIENKYKIRKYNYRDNEDYFASLWINKKPY